MTPTLLLDLDGTLVDSLPDLTASLNRTFVPRGFARFDDAEVRPFIGDGAPALVRRALAARGQADNQGILDAFLADYGAHASVATKPYPGVTETLAALKNDGWQLAVCTNKPEAPARELLGALGLLPMLAAVGGGDSFPVRKPDPEHLLSTLRLAVGDPAAAIGVGDHRNDVLAARGAGLPCIFAAWGYGPRSMAEGAAAVAERFADVPALAAKLLMHL